MFMMTPAALSVFSPRQRRILAIVALTLAFNGWPLLSHADDFRVDPFFDQSEGNQEMQLFHNDFHFATLLTQPDGIVVLRTRPDLNDVNAFGTSVFVGPFIAGADSGPGSSASAVATATGVNLVASGDVPSASGTSVGTWAWDLQITYDPRVQRVSGTGMLNVELDQGLDAIGADLNLARISSNFLADVPLQPNGRIGNTGDMSVAEVSYAPDGDPRDFTWLPPDIPVTFPQESSEFVAVNTRGDVNTVDTLAIGAGFQIDVAHKPDVAMSWSSLTGDQMTVGLVWDESGGQNFQDDNVGITPIVNHSGNPNQSFAFELTLESTPPISCIEMLSEPADAYRATVEATLAQSIPAIQSLQQAGDQAGAIALQQSTVNMLLQEAQAAVDLLQTECTNCGVELQVANDQELIARLESACLAEMHRVGSTQAVAVSRLENVIVPARPPRIALALRTRYLRQINANVTTAMAAMDAYRNRYVRLVGRNKPRGDAALANSTVSSARRTLLQSSNARIVRIQQLCDAFIARSGEWPGSDALVAQVTEAAAAAISRIQAAEAATIDVVQATRF